MDELKHYGVKGMHWGVRRYQNYDGTRIGATRRLPKPGKPKTGKLTKKEQRQEEALNYAVNRMKKKDYSKSSSKEIMDDLSKFKKEYDPKNNSNINTKEDFILKKDTNVYRVTSEQNETAEGRKYVTLDKTDSDYYKKEFDKTDAFGESEFGLYLDNYETTKPLAVAGQKSALKTLSELYDVPMPDLSKEIDLKRVEKEWTEKGFYDPLDVVYRNDFNRGEEYSRLLIKKGYDAVIDLNDSSIINSPIIILNPDKNIKKTSQETLVEPWYEKEEWK